jgi:hypothetical protein
MTLYALATPCGNEHVTTPCCVHTQGHTFSLLLEHCALLKVADVGNYSPHKHLVASVWVHRKSAQVKWWVKWWHCFSSNFESQLCAEQLCNRRESKPCLIAAWQILLRVFDQYPEQMSPWVSLLNLFYVPNTSSSSFCLPPGPFNTPLSASVVTTCVHNNWTVNAPIYPNSSNNLLIPVKGTVFARMSSNCHGTD